eukprot:TRINITY_DN9752_c0_g1_i3.p1 TRINITY_DN9752_c0_g1~~TRINITY_DN9752_c0_g1_i3.p1  ORF type:complete len:204 (+),score=21.25 TRINITY_DN9752_c0_g1_i3:48-659(+)
MIIPSIVATALITHVGFTKCKSAAECADGVACGLLPLVSGADSYCIGESSPQGTPYKCPLTLPTECCKDADCEGGGKNATCTSAPPGCGVAPMPTNVCAKDLCSLAEPCPNGTVCVPGVFDKSIRNWCAPAVCTTDKDCPVARSLCLPFADQLCDRLEGFFCAPPSSPCFKDSDCGNGNVCIYNTTRDVPQCVPWYPPPLPAP